MGQVWVQVRTQQGESKQNFSNSFGMGLNFAERERKKISTCAGLYQLCIL